MSVDVDQDHEQDFAETDPDARPLTVLDQFKAEREALADQPAREFELVIPDYQSNLQIVCKYPEGGSDAMMAAINRMQRQGKEQGATRDACLSLIVNCCDRIEARLPGGEWESLDPNDDRPLTFGPRLAAILSIDIERVKSPGRLLARHLYSPKAFRTGEFDGDPVAIRQGFELQAWLMKINDDLSAEFLGE